MHIGACQWSNLCAFVHLYFVSITLFREGLADLALTTIDAMQLALVALTELQRTQEFRRPG